MLTGLLGLMRVDVNGKVLSVLLLTEIAVVVVFDIADLINPAASGYSLDVFDPSNLFVPGIGAVVAICIASFAGFESSVVFSEETKDPRRTVPIATYVALAVISGLYALSSWAMTVPIGSDKIVETSREQSPALLFNLAGQHLGDRRHHRLPPLRDEPLRGADRLPQHDLPLHLRPRQGTGPARGLRPNLPADRRPGQRLGGAERRRAGRDRHIRGLRPGPARPTVLHRRIVRRPGSAHAAGGHLDRRAGLLRQEPRLENAWRIRIAPGIASVLLIVVLVLVLVNFDTVLGVAPDSLLRWVLPAVYFIAMGLGVMWALALRANRPKVYANIGLGAQAAVGGPNDRDHSCSGRPRSRRGDR